MTDKFDRKGNPLGLTEWANLMKDTKYQKIKQETLSNGNFVSTLWLGLNHNFGGGEPLIFETMVFPPDKKGDSLDMPRYSTEEEALVGHQEMIKKWG